MRILGIDIGLAATGYGIIDADGGSCRVVEGGVIQTEASTPLEQRLRGIHARIGEVLAEFEVDRVVVEDVYAKYRHPRTAIMMGHARGVTILAAAERGLEVASYPASLVKKALTGNGRASKDQVRRMVAQRLGMAEPPTPDHISDALALALCYANPARAQGELPEAVARALAEARDERR
jgi:crossover junction endodeoxyribonuclease RuvC